MHKYRRWLPVICLMLVIFGLSSIPDLVFFRDRLPPEWMTWIKRYSLRVGEGGFFSYGLSLHPDNLIHKAGHFILFGLLGAALYRATDRSVRLSLLISLLFAVSDEVHQGFVPGRFMRFGDILFDVLSAALFIGLMRCRRRGGG